MSSSTPEARRLWTPPRDPAAARRVEEWRVGAGALQAIGLDLRGADLSDLDLAESWFTAADLRGVRFVGSDLYRANLEDADLTGAVLARAGLGRARFDGAGLRSAVLTEATLSSASFGEVDAREADLRGTSLEGSTWLAADLHGAAFDGARLAETVLDATIDAATSFAGATGTVFGVLTLDDVELRGVDLEAHLRARGADVTVQDPRWTP